MVTLQILVLPFLGRVRVAQHDESDALSAAFVVFARRGIIYMVQYFAYVGQLCRGVGRKG